MFTSTLAFKKLKLTSNNKNVMLSGTGPHMTSFIARSKRKLDNNVRALDSCEPSLRVHITDKLVTEL